ncbi:MAG: hypothetical protein AAF206_15170 [Bacteroidota bacterium]
MNYQKLLAIFSLTLVFFLPSRTHAQDYSSALGLRAGTAAGITFKQFISYQGAIEFQAVYRRAGFRGVLLLAHHMSLGKKTNTYIFIGGGGHYGYNSVINSDNRAYRVAGVDGILGIEYEFPYAPLSVSLDWKPYYDLVGPKLFSGNNMGITARLLLN